MTTDVITLSGQVTDLQAFAADRPVTFDLRDVEQLDYDPVGSLIRTCRQHPCRLHVIGGSQPDRRLMLMLGHHALTSLGTPAPNEWIWELDLRGLKVTGCRQCGGYPCCCAEITALAAEADAESVAIPDDPCENLEPVVRAERPLRGWEFGMYQR